MDEKMLAPLVRAAVSEALNQAKTIDRWLRIDEVGEILGLGGTKVRELISSGRLRSIAIDAARRVPVSALREFQATIDPYAPSLN